MSLAGMESESMLRIMVPTLPLLRKGIASTRRRIDSTSKPALRGAFYKETSSEVLHSDHLNCKFSLAVTAFPLRHFNLGGQNVMYCRISTFDAVDLVL